MEKYTLKHAMNELKEQLRDSGYVGGHIDSQMVADFALKSLIIDELKQLNKNIERMNDFNFKYRK